jgi:hypothetical protein
LGRRPPNQPDATLDDVFKLMDENSSVNLVSPKMQQTFNPAPSSTFDNSALMAGKAMAKIDQITGLPLNADGTVTLFHHTNKNAAQSIQKTGVLKSAGEPSVYLTTERTPTTGYGDTVVSVKVNPSKLNLDDEFPNGRLDFSIDVGKPGGSVKVAPVPSFTAPQDEALRLAQQRASLPPSQGGLGLPAGNTPEQRAAAMGFDTDVYHGTNRTFDKFDNSMLGANTGAKSAQKAHFVTPSSTLANSYVKTNDIYNQSPPALAALFDKPGAWEEFLSAPNDAAKWSVLEKYGLNTGSGQILPLKINLGKSKIVDYAGSNYRDTTYNDAIKAAKKSKKDSVVFKNTFDPGGESKSGMADVYAVMNPENIRSRFAAFDPWRKTAAIAATMGVAAPDLLAGQSPQQAPKFDNSALMK